MRLITNSVFITLVCIVLAMGIAYALPKANTEAIAVSQAQSSQGASQQGQQTIDKDSIKPVDGGLKGGNQDAVKKGRLPSSADKPINTDPDVFLYKINHTISFDSPTSDGTIMIENDPGNKNSMQLYIYLNDTQRLVYTSPMLSPNEHINGDKLQARLKKGEYQATVVIGVYDMETQAIETTIYDDAKLTVNDTWWNSLFG